MRRTFFTKLSAVLLLAAVIAAMPNYAFAQMVRLSGGGGGGAAFSGGAITSPILAADGTNAAPSYSFSSDTGTGIYRFASGSLGFSNSGSANIVFNYDSGGQIKLASAGYLSWVPASTMTAGPDLFLNRAAAASLQLGTNSATPIAQTLGAASARAGTDSNVTGANLTIQPGNGTGTGGSGSIIFQTAPNGSTGSAADTMTTALTINKGQQLLATDGTGSLPAFGFASTAGVGIAQTSGYLLFASLNGALPSADNGRDFGNPTNRWRGVYSGRIITGAATPTVAVAAGFGTSPSAAVDTGSSDMAGIITVTNGTGGTATNGSITVTYSTGNGAYGTNTPSVMITPMDGAGAWNDRVTCRVTASSTTAFTAKCENNLVALTASTTYKIAYHSIGK